jgi:hypothetical protein
VARSLGNFLLHMTWKGIATRFEGLWNVQSMHPTVRPDVPIKRFTHFASHIFDADQTNTFLNACHENKATLTGAVIGSLAQGCNHLQPSGKRIFVVFPCEIRKTFYKGDPLPISQLGVQISATVPYPVLDASDVWSTARDFKSFVASCVRTSQLEILATWVMAYAVSDQNPGRNHTLMFTNWGKLPIKNKYGNYILDGAIYPFINVTGAHNVAAIASTGPNGMTMSVIGGNHLIEEGTVKELLEKSAQVLVESCVA